MSTLGYRVRLRVRLGKALTSDATSIAATCSGRVIEVKSQKLDQPLKHAKWVVFLAKGFDNEVAARAFGERLRAQIELAALCSGVGVDTGQDRPTSGISEDWARDSGLIGADERLFQNVHGLLIVPDDEKNRIPMIEATATVTADPAHFLGAISELSEAGLADLGDCTAGIQLLNAALMSSEALAKAVLAFSAVEALGQDEVWSERQRSRLEELASAVEEDAAGKDNELLEICDALRRSLYRMGLRQGVMRVLERLDLRYLKGDWDRLYAIRSGIFHGTRRLEKPEVDAFANEALSLSTRIVISDLRAKGRHVPLAFGRHFDT